METPVVSDAELRSTSAELLPTREALSWINITTVAGVNISIAVNAASAGAIANAIALQSLSATSV
jgi:hypothetical protein